ncbi:suppressor of kinetochore protein mutant, partial [Tyrophagus putrescentiae]
MEGMPGPSKPSPPEEEKKLPMIKLKSSDGVIIKVNFKVARLSVTLRTMLDNLGIAEGDAKDAKDDDEDPIPLANVDAATLRKVIQWATHHQDTDPLTLENSDNENVLIPPWDDAFLGELDQKMLLGIIEAANYLDIKGLQNFSVQKVVDMIRGKTVEQLR